MSEIYRGYDIEQKDGSYVVSKDGKAVSSQPSLEDAQTWVDQERRKAAKAAK